MKLILIDAWEKEVREVEVEKLDLDKIYELLKCDCIEGHRIPGIPDHAFYCDEEGKLKTPLPPPVLLAGFFDVLRGNVLVFRQDGDDEVSVTVPLKDIRDRVLFKWRGSDDES